MRIEEDCGYPLEVPNEFVSGFVFGEKSAARSLRGTGIGQGALNRWSLALVRGRVPEGLRTTEEFVVHFLEIVAESNPGGEQSQRTIKRAQEILIKMGQDEG